MLKLRKTISILVAVMMLAAMYAAVPTFAIAGTTNKVVVADFTNPDAEIPFYNSASNATTPNQLYKSTEQCYGEAEQSGKWTVAGSSGVPGEHFIDEVKRAALSETDTFVVRFYSSTSNDVFHLLFIHTDAKTYIRHKITVTKQGWQEAVIPVSAITTKVPVDKLGSLKLNKGKWDNLIEHNTNNVLYFDSMWFEKRVSNVAVDADDDNSQMTLVSANHGSLTKDTATVYDGSTSSIKWNYSRTDAGTSRLNTKDLNIEPAKYGKVTIRFYSEQTDQLVFLVVSEGYKNNYKTATYGFSTAENNIGKWIEYEISVNDTTKPITQIAMVKGINAWGTNHNANNTIYIDKIWFGESEDINTTFSYIKSDYANAQNVGVFDIITFEFGDYLAEEVDCDAVEVTRDSNPVTEFKAWTDRNLLYVKTDDAMAFNSPYKIKVTQALTDQRGYTLYADEEISFTTKAPYLAIDEVKITDADGNKLSSVPAVGSTAKVSASIVNGSATSQSAVAIIAMYDKDGKLLKVSLSEPKNYDANMSVSAEISALCAVVDKTASIRGFLWDGLSKMLPLGLPEEI